MSDNNIQENYGDQSQRQETMDRSVGDSLELVSVSSSQLNDIDTLTAPSSISFLTREIESSNRSQEEILTPNLFPLTGNHRTLPRVIGNRPVQSRNTILETVSLHRNESAESFERRRLPRRSTNSLSSRDSNRRVVIRNPIHSWTMTAVDLFHDTMIQTENNVREYASNVSDQITSSSERILGSSTNNPWTLNGNTIVRQNNDRRNHHNTNVRRGNTSTGIIETRDSIEENGLDLRAISTRRRLINESQNGSRTRSQRAFSDSFVDAYDFRSSYRNGNSHSSSIYSSYESSVMTQPRINGDGIQIPVPSTVGSRESISSSSTRSPNNIYSVSQEQFDEIVGPTIVDSSNDADNPTGDNREEQMERANRWIRINQFINFTITFVAFLFSLLLFTILVCWVVLTSAYVVSIDKPCDVPLKGYYWFATVQLILDVFRGDIMRYLFCYEYNDFSRRRIPRRVIIYNTIYMVFAMITLSTGIYSVFFVDPSCAITAPELFQTSKIFIVLSLAAWASILLVYLIPFFFVGIFLTRHGYLPPSMIRRDVSFGGNFFAPRSMGAPPECIDHLQVINVSDFPPEYPNECCICMVDFEPEDEIIATPCEHVFHRSCCKEWLRHSRTCPVCRLDLPASFGMVESSSYAAEDELNRQQQRRANATDDHTITGEGVQRDVEQFFRNWTLVDGNDNAGFQASP